MISIVWIDMQIRDERVYEWLKQKLVDGEGVITYEQIALEFHCHRLTARAILKRLIGCGHIECDSRVKRGGYVYRIVSR